MSFAPGHHGPQHHRVHPPQAGHPPTSPLTEPVWVPRGKEHRTIWGCGSGIAGFLLFCALLYTFEADGTAAALVFLALSLVVVFFLVKALPWAIAEQGVGIDAGGVSFAQKSKWWFRGRTLRVPWHEVVAITNVGPGGQEHGSGSETPILSEISFYLLRTPPKELAPTWMKHVAEGADDPAHAAHSPLPRVAVVFQKDQAPQVMGALAGFRPDLIQKRGPDHVPGAPVTPGAPGAAGPRTPRQVNDTVESRGGAIFQWVILSVIALGLACQFTLMAALRVPDMLAEGHEGVLPVVGFVLLLGLGSLTFLTVQIIRAPRAFTSQGVHVDAYGLSLFREPKWWFRGERAHVGWQDVHHIDSRMVRQHKSMVQEVDIHLYRATHEMRLPPWARLLLSGETRQGFTADRHPVLLLRLPGPGTADRLLGLVRRARPDLLREENEQSRVRERDARNQAAQSAQAVPAAGPAPQGWRSPEHAPSAWVSMWSERAGGWIAGAVFLFLMWGFLGYLLVDIVATGGEYTFPGFVFFLLVAVPLSAWSIRLMPHRLAHQGVSVDGYGITLVEDPFLWSGGSTVHLPWDQVRLVVRTAPRVSGSSVGGRRVNVLLTGPDRLSSVPHWCHLVQRELEMAPAGTHTPLTRVRLDIPSKQQVRVLDALRAVRPDLVAAD